MAGIRQIRHHVVPPITTTTARDKTPYAQTVAAAKSEETLITSREEQGRKAWRLLHSYPGNDPHWVQLWFKFIPKMCDCESGLMEILTTHKFDFTTPETLFESGVHIHNAVNKKLNKPQFTLDQAWRLWKPLRDSKYCLHIPTLFGGLERWAISLSNHLPSFGIASITPGDELDSNILNQLYSKNTKCTLEEATLCNKTILVSNAFDFKKPLGSKVVAVAHGYCEYTKNWVSRVNRYADHLVAVSESVGNAVREWTNRIPIVIENGVDMSRITPTKSKEALRELYGLPQDAFVIGTVGRFTEEKGTNRFLEVLAAKKTAHGVVVGWGDINAVISRARNLKVEDRLVVLPAVENVGDVYAAMDVFVSLPTQEGFGLAVMEAMLSNLPVVTTRTGIAEDLYQRHGEYGTKLCTQFQTPWEIADLIDSAIPVTIDLSNYTSEAMASRWSDFLSSI